MTPRYWLEVLYDGMRLVEGSDMTKGISILAVMQIANLWCQTSYCNRKTDSSG